jgi:hypothetical protein
MSLLECFLREEIDRLEERISAIENREYDANYIQKECLHELIQMPNSTYQKCKKCGMAIPKYN